MSFVDIYWAEHKQIKTEHAAVSENSRSMLILRSAFLNRGMATFWSAY